MKKMKKLNTERLPKNILGDIRQSLGVNKDDTSKDDQINKMSNNELLKNFFIWHGFISYEYKIKNAIEKIYEIELK